MGRYYSTGLRTLNSTGTGTGELRQKETFRKYSADFQAWKGQTWTTEDPKPFLMYRSQSFGLPFGCPLPAKERVPAWYPCFSSFVARGRLVRLAFRQRFGARRCVRLGCSLHRGSVLHTCPRPHQLRRAHAQLREQCPWDQPRWEHLGHQGTAGCSPSFQFTRLPFWVHIFDPQPFGAWFGGLKIRRWFLMYVYANKGERSPIQTASSG